MQCLFCRITAGTIAADTRYQDEKVIAFADIHPQAPVHLLIIPRDHIATLNDLTAANANIISHMTQTAVKLANDLNLSAGGYRLVMNCNADAGQSVFHIHMHLLGGRLMDWPPG